MLLTVGVSLYTVRLVLNTLGVEDFGLYNVVGGIVALLAFLPGAMGSATQRFFSYALGEGDREKLKRIFCVNWTVYALLAGFALVILETAGGWFIADYVKIAPERYDAALALYRVSVWTFILSVLTSPFRAAITAHEDMHLYAGISILEVVLKLAAVLALAAVPGDKLVLYGWLLLGVGFVVTVVYASVCWRRYEECQFRRFYWDSTLLREVLGFTGWTLFGQLTTVVRNQALTILMNQVFNPVVVAARAIALNVATQTNLFATNFNTSLYPPIIKSYASGDRRAMYELVFSGSKITFFLMWILALPMFLQMPLVLALWLKTPPPDAVLFTRLAFIDALINAASLPLMTAARAPGKMRFYELSLGSIQLGIFLVSWFVLRAGGAPYSVFVIAIAASAIMLALRLVIVRHLTGISVRAFVSRVLLPVIAVVALSLVPSVVLTHLLPEGLSYAVFSAAGCFGLAACAIYFVGLDAEWRLKVKTMVVDKCGKIFAGA